MFDMQPDQRLSGEYYNKEGYVKADSRRLRNPKTTKPLKSIGVAPRKQ